MGLPLPILTFCKYFVLGRLGTPGKMRADLSRFGRGKRGLGGGHRLVVLELTIRKPMLLRSWLQILIILYLILAYFWDIPRRPNPLLAGARPRKPREPAIRIGCAPALLNADRNYLRAGAKVD